MIGSQRNGKRAVGGISRCWISTLANSAGCGYICLRSSLSISHRLSQSSGIRNNHSATYTRYLAFFSALGLSFAFLSRRGSERGDTRLA